MYLITTCFLPLPPPSEGTCRLPVERPKHELADHVWDLVSMHVDGSVITILWRDSRKESRQYCPDCSANIGPPYGEGFKLTCPCGRSFTSTLNTTRRVFEWEGARP
jgi:hypothetical protein